MNQWAALNGKAASPRDEIFFDMPQNSSFRFGSAEVCVLVCEYVSSCPSSSYPIIVPTLPECS